MTTFNLWTCVLYSIIFKRVMMYESMGWFYFTLDLGIIELSPTNAYMTGINPLRNELHKRTERF